MLKTKLIILSITLMMICTGCGAEGEYSLPVYGDPPATEPNTHTINNYSIEYTL